MVKKWHFYKGVVQIRAAIYYVPGFALKGFRQFINKEMWYERTLIYKHIKDISISLEMPDGKKLTFVQRSCTNQSGNIF